jgi:hypothetical protein
MDRETLKQLSGWMGFVGIMTIIAGVLSAIAGVFAFVIGAIPGVIMVILGIKLRSAQQNADTLVASPTDEVDPTQFNLFTSNLNTYFKVQGILIIISLALALILILLSLALGFTMYNYF